MSELAERKRCGAVCPSLEGPNTQAGSMVALGCNGWEFHDGPHDWEDGSAYLARTLVPVLSSIDVALQAIADVLVNSRKL